MSAAIVLGVKSPVGGDWSQLQGSQYALLAARLPMRIALHLAGAALFFFLFQPFVGSLIVGAWAVVVVLVTADGARLDLALRDANRRIFTRDEYRRHTLYAALKGAVWVVPAFLFMPYADPATNAVAWGFTAMVLLVSAVSRYGAPAGTVVFCAVTALGTAAGLFVMGETALGAVAIATGLAATSGTIEGARVALSARIAQLGMNEKSEVVSLLLREYEDSDADWLFELDPRRRLRSVSPRLAVALGRELADIEGRSFLELISGSAWETGRFPSSLHEFAEKLKKRENFSNLVVEVMVNDKRRWWELSGASIFSESGSYAGFRGVGSDVTTQRESSEKIAYLARFDTLTALPNRLMLNEALGDAIAYAEKWRTRCAFLMIDLDRFKAVNDSLGHLTGDRLLGQVAGRLKSLMTENEICGRLGGDEFGVVIRDASDRSQVEQVANSIIEHLSEPYQVDQHILYVGASIGAAFGPRDGRSVEELMRNADLSLYRAKDSGGGEYREYEPSLHASAEERRQLEFSLRNALKNDELSLNYQPVVDANTEELVSFEALVRWNSDVHGAVSPGKFIPLAEDTRLIVPIGKWVMQQACCEAANWPGHIGINVNVSPEQLVEPDFVTSVVHALSHSGLPAERLEIEVTESIFLRDANVARRALEQVMALGCSVALDDFGTGYSSLGYLRKLRFSTIKVDQTFVQGASQDSAESLAIINAVVAMARSLGMTTTAEGVETAEEAEMIRSMGCNKIQGYHFGRPMPAAEARRVFEREEARRLA
ncbi:MAG: EAL domain-containing protein [Alphaproteobacteria bacterium]|nr:EAL domain-containing protein [Alphaproteobacteria bacterium]